MKNKNFSKFECIDAGTEYCPCYLAKLGECYECPLLRGEKFATANGEVYVNTMNIYGARVI